ncbi:hypothetical protein FS837_004623, partial [Tulasnella sp. UAMH 9824]
MTPIEPNLVRNETSSAPKSQSMPPPNINNALPSELLLQVFDSIYVEKTQPMPRTAFAAGPRTYPLLNAMLVCRTWHDLIVASPQYWTSVNIWIGGPYDPWLGETERTRKREAERIMLERRLKRSGELPFQVNIESNSDVDLELIFDCLRSQEHRWQALDLFPTHISASVYRSQLTSLFSTPLSCLTSLRVGPFWAWMESGSTKRTWFWVDAPNLCALSCESNFVIPHSTSSLKFLSLTFVFPLFLEPRVGEPRVELGGLIELRILHCDAMPILSIFFTPNLCRLVVRGVPRSSPPPGSLAQYQHLKELQCADGGPPEHFHILAPLCPNITSFANYVVGLEEESLTEAKHREISSPVILREQSAFRVNKGRAKCLWPKLEEILLSSATCAEITELTDALPSVHG